ICVQIEADGIFIRGFVGRFAARTSRILMAVSPAPRSIAISLARRRELGALLSQQARASSEVAPCARIGFRQTVQCATTLALLFSYLQPTTSQPSVEILCSSSRDRNCLFCGSRRQEDRIRGKMRNTEKLINATVLSRRLIPAVSPVNGAFLAQTDEGLVLRNRERP